MFTIKDLKDRKKNHEHLIECPVLDCNIFVDRRRLRGNEGKNFVCIEHNILITPSTFIYQNLRDNLLDDTDLILLNKIFKSKRESRLRNDNSEDAVSWNIFRYLETENILLKWLNNVSNESHSEIKIMYWSFWEEGTYHLLKNARCEFGEDKIKGSEPDIIIITDKTLFIIEAKLFSSNKTSGYGQQLLKRVNYSKKYKIGGNNLFDELFISNNCDIVKDQKYELMRFWLLGFWMAKQNEKKFQLLNLVLDRNEKEIETDFGKHIIQSSDRNFYRITWESIYHFIKEHGSDNLKKERVLNYFENKGSGYNENGKIKRKAFDV